MACIPGIHERLTKELQIIFPQNTIRVIKKENPELLPWKGATNLTEVQYTPKIKK